MYLAEFQAQHNQREEDWAAFAEDLQVLANKAFPKLQKEAKEQLTLGQIHVDNPPVAFGVKQQHPKRLETTVTSVIELESYHIAENFHGLVRSDHFAEKTFAEC